jgi:hypothetical protein
MTFLRAACYVGGGCVALYAASAASLYWLMRQPLDRFGAIMRHVPNVAMAILPFEPMWMSARAGNLRAGNAAPDFTLPTVDHTRHVKLSDEYRDKPVVLIFGSYT